MNILKTVPNFLILKKKVINHEEVGTDTKIVAKQLDKTCFYVFQKRRIVSKRY